MRIAPPGRPVEARPGRLLRALFVIPLLILPVLSASRAASAAPEGADALRAAHTIEQELVGALRRVEDAGVSIVGRQAIRSRSGSAGPHVLQGAGSGVLIQWNGTWVLTNAHVVGADGVGAGGTLEAVTSDGRSHPLSVRAIDRDRDLAIARLPTATTGLRAVRVPISPRMTAGTWVVSSGNPFLLALDGRSAAAMGVISAMRPPRRGSFVKVTTVQHDAEVNPGNSGGPVWSLRGELLGINGSIATRSAGADGAGAHYTGASFAVPTREIRSFLTSVLGADQGGTQPPVATPTALRGIEGEYRHAIDRLMPASVVCVPRGVVGPAGGRSSGVVVHPKGLVLSDGDAGLVFRQTIVDGRATVTKTWQKDVDIRLWDPAKQLWRTIPGYVLHRDPKVDTSLIQLLRIPAGGMPSFVTPGRSTIVRTGDATLAMGSSYDPRSQGPPALTAGIVSTIDAGAHGFLYTSAGVNPGVNGGALVDLRGQLIGTISTYVEAGTEAPYGFLGKAVPIDRILAALRDVPAARDLFTAVPQPIAEVGVRALSSVTYAAGRRVRPHLVSITVERKTPISRTVPLHGRNITLERYAGPVTGVVAGPDGLVVTSLYNLTNVAQRVDPLWRVPTGASMAEGVASIRRLRVRTGDGRMRDADLVGYDMRWGFALLRVKDTTGWRGAPAAAPASSLQRGRFVIAAGDPSSTTAGDNPLLTRGILSKQHAESAPSAWRGMWQTDAGVLDGNVGGAALDIDGRIVGMLTTWDPAQHGRNSGIGFVVPWQRIQASIPALLRGESPERGMLGIWFRSGLPTVDRVSEASGAMVAGLRSNDTIRSVDGYPTPTIYEVLEHIGQGIAGERVRLVIERDGQLIEVTVVLGKRSV